MAFDESVTLVALWDMAADQTRDLTRQFDGLARLAAAVCGAPVGLISLVGEHEQRFLGAFGLEPPWSELRATPRDYSICQHVASTGTPVVMDDTRDDDRLTGATGGPAVTELGVAAYLGVPLRTPDGKVVGAVCALDRAPRAWTPEQVATVQEVARQAEQVLTRAQIDVDGRCA